jgi:ribosomal protein L37AE/L43A
MAKTSFWICVDCGFANAPHAYRKGDANKRCEQCGASQESGADSDVELITKLKAGK